MGGQIKWSELAINALLSGPAGGEHAGCAAPASTVAWEDYPHANAKLSAEHLLTENWGEGGGCFLASLGVETGSRKGRHYFTETWTESNAYAGN